MLSTMLRSLLVLLLLMLAAEAFPLSAIRTRQCRCSRYLVLQQQHAATDTLPEAVAKLKAQAEQMRLEAEDLDMQLTLHKISRLEAKLAKKRMKPVELDAFELELEQLQRKLTGQPAPVKTIGIEKLNAGNKKKSRSSQTETTENTFLENSTSVLPPSQSLPELSPIQGFDNADLAIYLPIGLALETSMPNATLEEKIEAFRAHPALQSNLQEHIIQSLVEPMRDIQQLEDLEHQYLYSTSRVEKDQIKRDMERLEKAFDEDDGPFVYVESLDRGVPPLTQEELNERLEAIGALPQVLQALYKQLCDVKLDGDLELAVLLNHYKQQLQLLEQIQYIGSVRKDKLLKAEAMSALEGLPSKVRHHIAVQCGLSDGGDMDKLLLALEKGKMKSVTAWTQSQRAIYAGGSNPDEPPDLPEYNDIDFVDRSRYVTEFYPAVARLEGQHPSEECVEQFVMQVLDRTTYMVTSKPERVEGGYYIRGENRISDDDDGLKLVERIQQRLSPELEAKVAWYYIPDPQPQTDEQVEMGYMDQPLILVTANNATLFYNYATPLACWQSQFSV
jgi:hypothetical protein